MIKESKQLIEFFGGRLRELCTNPKGQVRYLAEADKVLKDIFDTPHFIQTLCHCDRSQQVVSLINQNMGLKNLFAILSDDYYFGMLTLMVKCLRRKASIRLDLKSKKNRKKKKKLKDLQEQYEYLDEKYRKARKTFQDLFGISKKAKKKSYKKEFSDLADFGKKKNSYSFFDDGFDDFDDADFDDDFDDDNFNFAGTGSNAFDRFMNQINKTRVQPKKRHKPVRDDEDDDDDDDDFDDDDDEFDDDEDEIDDEDIIRAQEKKIRTLERQLGAQNHRKAQQAVYHEPDDGEERASASEVINIVGIPADQRNEKTYAEAQEPVKRQKPPAARTEYPPEEDNDDRLIDVLTDLATGIKNLNDGQKEIIKSQALLANYLSDDDDDEEEEEDVKQVPKSNPPQQDQNVHYKTVNPDSMRPSSPELRPAKNQN